MPYVASPPATREAQDGGGREPLGGDSRPPARARAGRRPAASSSFARCRPGRHRRARSPLPAPVAAAAVPGRQARARHPGARRRADSAAGAGAEAGAASACATSWRAGGAGEAAEHIKAPIDETRLDAGSLLTASLNRDQAAIRTGAAHRGLAPDLLWLVAELAVSPFVHALQQAFSWRRARRLARWRPRWTPGTTATARRAARGRRSPRSPNRTACCAARSARSRWELKPYACVLLRRSRRDVRHRRRQTTSARIAASRSAAPAAAT